jgi:hypothetical protein
MLMGKALRAVFNSISGSRFWEFGRGKWMANVALTLYCRGAARTVSRGAFYGGAPSQLTIP